MSNNTQPEIRFPGFTEDWEERKLNELAEFNPKSDLPERFEYVDLESVVGTELVGHRTENRYSAPSRAQRLAKKNDVFYQTVRPYQKNNYLFDLPYDNYVFSTGYAQMRPIGNGYFLLTLIQEEKFVNRVLERSTGTSYPAINSNDLAKLPVKVPADIQEQQKVGTFFKQIDNTITLHQRKLDLLKETKKGFLQKMFPKNGAKVPEIRFPGFTEAWEERKLGSIYDFSKGKGLPLNSFTYSKDDPAIAYGHLYTKYSEVISEVYLSSDDDGVLSKDNDLLFPGSSTVPNGTAQANAIMLNNVKLGGDIIIARPKQDTRVLSIFMSYQINSQRQKLFPITVGTTITHMYGKDLSKVKFFITNYSEQQKIGAFFKQLDDTIALHQRKLDLLKETKKGFLQKMFV
ncbi:restriction endonuclease subunit S [Enterococcus faecium]|uniref:restriction endonuclease subunit S n=1 Tax=Enterococcus faecium TaxID=1352 RepID=UPI0019D6C686|nr:restriction endonuclease subunit S [Enterococcus faecium]